MTSIVINTTKLSSGISYEWDLNWDIKTQKDARMEYQKLKKKLVDIPAQLKRMEELAQKDKFKL